MVIKKTIALIVILALAVCVLAGCGGGREGTPPDSGPSESADAGTRTVTDSAGRTVEIPSTVEKIVALGNTPRMITYLGLADKVAGIGGMAPDRITPVTAYAYANKDRWAHVPVVGTDAAGATDYYPEEIIAVAPDVVVCSYTKELGDQIQAKTGVPVVVVPMGTLFEADYEEALRLLGDVCGAQERAEEAIAYINGCLGELKDKTADVPDGDKPTALGAAATFKGAHGIEGVYTNYAVFEAISANDVTRELPGAAGVVVVDKEQVLGWNPHTIFFDSGGVPLVKADYEKTPDFYAHLAAVRDGRLYQYPSATSYFANVEISLVNSYYAASILYPEQFKDMDFKEKADEIFRFFLGVDGYLEILEAVGAGYGSVTLGGG